MNLSFEEFQKAKAAGYSSEDIARLASFDAPKKSVTTSAPKSNVQGEIAARGNVWENIKNDFMSPNPVRKTMGALSVVASPLTAIENTVANPSLAMQAGNFNPVDLAKEAYKGFTGQKQGQYGDVYREAGVPKPLAATAGLVLNASPIKAANMASKALSGISKMSDKGILKAGNSLINAGKQAETTVGTALNDAFKAVDNAPVDPTLITDTLAKLPKQLLGKIEEVFGGQIDLTKVTVGQLRKMKQLIGKYRPSAFGKDARGVSENIEADEINTVYSAMKNLMEGSVVKAAGKDVAKKLMGLEKKFSEVTRASDYVKRTVVDPILMKATEAGKMAGKIQVEGKVGGRVALNTLRNAGKEAKKSINKAMTEMEAFNRWRAASEVGRKLVNAMVYGGIGGSLGGLALGNIVKRDSD